MNELDYGIFATKGSNEVIKRVNTDGSVDVLIGRPVELEGVSVVRVLSREEDQPGISWRVMKTHLIRCDICYNSMTSLAVLWASKVCTTSDDNLPPLLESGLQQ